VRLRAIAAVSGLALLTVLWLRRPDRANRDSGLTVPDPSPDASEGQGALVPPPFRSGLEKIVNDG
jgi:hypothetical protein